VRLLPRLLGWLKPYRARVAGALLCMAAFAGLTVAIARSIQPLLDEGLFARPATEPERAAALRRLLALGGFVLAATALKSLAKYGADYLSGSAGQRVMYDLRAALFDRLLGLSLSFFHRHRTGELLSRVVADVGAMQQMLTQLIGPAVSAVISIAGLSAFLLWLDWNLAVLALLVFPVAVWPIRNFGKRLRGLSRRVQELAADLASHLEETLSQMKLVQAYRGEARESARWRAKLSEQLAASLGALRVQARSSPIMETIGAVGFFALIAYAGWRIHGVGAMTGGALGSFLGTVLLLYPQVKQLNGLWNNLQAGLAAAERVVPLLDEVPEIADAPGAAPLPPFLDRIEYDGVTFAYRPGEPVLHGVTLEIRRGERIAFVGPSGAGKTTLIDLLLRFHDPSAGAIRVDGRDVRSVTLASLRDQIALVTQETLLFNATVRENLAYGRPDATDAQIEAAAKAAGAHEFLAGLPRGYATVIGERGVTLSGGERQRVSIARAFLKDAPILVLDEATASLDAASEALIQAALDRLMANRTVLVVAHRLATVRRADRIVVLDRGRIVEEGTHETLYRAGGLYRRLCDLQFSDAPAA
jgi:subfamily B ATP-binding cassette protein MsbA